MSTEPTTPTSIHNGASYEDGYFDHHAILVRKNPSLNCIVMGNINTDFLFRIFRCAEHSHFLACLVNEIRYSKCTIWTEFLRVEKIREQIVAAGSGTSTRRTDADARYEYYLNNIDAYTRRLTIEWGKTNFVQDMFNNEAKRRFESSNLNLPHISYEHWTNLNICTTQCHDLM